MQVIKRISEFFKAANTPIPLLKRNESLYKPATRLEKIRNKDFIYPCSTQHRFIFIANLDGSGFQRHAFPNCPDTIPLVKMMDEINRGCYRQWERNRSHYQSHPFQRLNNISNFTLAGAILLMVVLQILVSYGDTDTLTNYLFVFLCFLLTSFSICLMVYFAKIPDEDTDFLMISCIQGKLKEFNDREIEYSKNNPRFMWTSHKDCLWIALRI